MSKKFTYSSSDTDVIIHNYIEINMDPHLLNNFSNEDGMAAFLTSRTYSEEFQKLKYELLQEIMYIIDTNLTSKQKEVIVMTYFEGKTQDEISLKLGRHQSTVHKTLRGNIDYNNNKKRYGGALKKIKKLCENNEKIKKILLKMKEQYVVTTIP